ncbi:MAG: Xaa-Pro dipeptidase [Gemmatimonadales bacterium]|nr:MAG: Xaa-Pro dipeptidase [Gemmatimonadales bacterium]
MYGPKGYLGVIAVALAAALGSGISRAAQASQERPAGLVLRNANVIDVASGAVVRNATVVVSGTRIERVASTRVEAPAGVREVDLGGKFVLPGLIDAHVHISNLDAARRALLSGVTTARSMGTGNFADVGLRELLRAGHIDAPEILAAGYHIRPDPADGLFLDAPELGDLIVSGLKGTEALRRAVRVMLAHRVDFIKVNATERAGTPQTDPRKPLYSEEELRAIVEEARTRGIPVAAHAHGDEGGRAAVLAGVRSVEHGTFLSDSTLRLMASRGTYLVPTIAVVTDLTLPGGDYDNAGLQIRGRFMLPRLRETASKAHRAGVKIVAATDTGYGPNSVVRLSHELEELVGVGLTPLQAIQSATTVAAELLGIQDRTGRVAPGLEADLIVVERNPLEELRTLQDVLMVVNNGKIVLDRLNW